jgi:hypothetical protein
MIDNEREGPMRPIINSTLVSLMNHMDMRRFGYVNDESDQLTYDEFASCDATLMGRKTYDGAMGPRDTMTLANPSPSSGPRGDAPAPRS